MSSKKAVFGPRDSSDGASDTTDASQVDDTGLSDKFSLEPLGDADADIPAGGPAETTPQVSEKASFYAPDPELDTSEAPASGAKKKYMGVERRKTNRRSGSDRRTDVRFELDDSDRRKSEGRRAEDKTPKYW